MTAPPTIENLAELMMLVDSAHQSAGVPELWWRGQSADWPLIPSAFRDGRGYEFEQSVATKFKQRAVTRHPACPPDKDWAAWLFLTQHYRVPTRLLDWTRSPLVAAFFACEGLLQADGVLWGLNPFGLNAYETGQNVILTPYSEISSIHGHVGVPDEHFEVRTMFQEAFFGAGWFGDGIQKVLAVKSDESDNRMRIQLSAYTIHGGKDALNLRGSKGTLWSYTVPAAAKIRLRRGLDQVGITRSYLFPDLENLAMELMDRHSRE